MHASDVFRVLVFCGGPLGLLVLGELLWRLWDVLVKEKREMWRFWCEANYEHPNDRNRRQARYNELRKEEE